MAKKLHIISLCLISWGIMGCATYYQRNQKLNDLIVSGNYQSADKLLSKNEKDAKGKDRVLYFFNHGVTSFMLGNYEESNRFFRQADYYIEDFSKNYGLDALALISNPSIKPYRPEDFESVMIHFYMALNHLFMTDYEGAIVECRRVNLQIQKINDKYKQNKNRYSLDAFSLNMMGLIYEASGDYNNAFIAYRNAVDAYETVYGPLFKIQVPQALKESVVRSAYLTGFTEDAAFFEKKFNIRYRPEPKGNGTVVYFWMTGFGPIKAEWGINFVNTASNDGFINLSDSESGISFPIYIGNRSAQEQSAFKNLSFLRVAFPKYVPRPPAFWQASISTNNNTYNLELAQDINQIAIESLKDRMLREIAGGIARLATKKALEALANKQNENLGTLVSIVNAITEKADTRNWQSLPYSISYARISLPPGQNKLTLNASGNATTSDIQTVEVKSGQTQFKVFHHH